MSESLFNLYEDQIEIESQLKSPILIHDAKLRGIMTEEPTSKLNLFVNSRTERLSDWTTYI